MAVAAYEQPIALADFLKRVLMSATKLAPVISEFPVSTAGGRPGVDLRSAAYHVLGLEVDLLEMSRAPIETRLDELIAVGLPLTVNSSTRLRALARSVTLEDQESSKEKRAWTWSGAQAKFDAHVRPAMSDATRCEWDDLVDGAHLHELDDWLHATIQLALELLQSPPRETATQIRRRGSAHEEHVYGGRSWCAICGWLDMITDPTGTTATYHGGITAASRQMREDLRQLGLGGFGSGPKN